MNGWTVGPGFEWVFAPHLIALGEYRYAGYGSTRATFFANVPVDSIRVRTDQSVHAIAIGISYLFN
jgi:opacity protein-like surface antigen